MHTRQRIGWLLGALLSVGALQGQAADDKKDEKPATAKAMEAPADSTTEGTVTVKGQAIAYTAVAGTLTVGATNSQDALLALDGKWLPDAGEAANEKPADQPATARIFYTAYFKKGAANETRPITFLYNGDRVLPRCGCTWAPSAPAAWRPSTPCMRPRRRTRSSTTIRACSM